MYAALKILTQLRAHFTERKVLEDLHPRMPQDKIPLLIFVNKGIETGTQALTLEIIAEACGKEVAKVSTFLVCLGIT